MTPARCTTAGVTLVEVLVALVLFALIGVAGFGMLDQILRTQSVTERRLERLAVIQRGMYLMTTDFAQARSGSLTFQTGNQGAVVAVARNATETGEGSIGLTYRLEGATLLREVTTPAGRQVARQPVLDGVTGIDWQFYDSDLGWVDEWPPVRAITVLSQRPPNPKAVAAVISLDGARQLRRVAPLPSEPR